MTTNFASAQLAAARATGYPARQAPIRDQYKTWLDSKTDVGAAQAALELASRSSRTPSKVLIQAEVNYGSFDDFPDPLSATYARRGEQTISPVLADPGGGFLHWENVGSGSSIHLTSGVGFTGPYLLGVGNNNGVQDGVVVANKAGGIGLHVDNWATSSAHGLHLNSRSATAAGAWLEQDPNTAPLLVLKVVTGAVAGQKALHVITPGGDGDAGWVAADTGVLRWAKNVEVGAASGAASLIVRGNKPEGSDDTTLVYQKSDQTQYFVPTGTAGTYYPKRVFAQGQRLQLEVATGTPALTDTLTWVTGITVSQTSGQAYVGFFGNNGSPKRTSTPAATDLATVITLANALRADLMAFNLKG